MALRKRIPVRYSAYLACILTSLITLLLSPLSAWWLVLALPALALTVLGTWDLLQTRHTISRNYPVLAHFRYFLESIGPEIRQYFIFSDTEGRPFSREQRRIVYQRAKNTLDKRPFGSLLDMEDPGHEWINHSLTPVEHAHTDFRITIGSRCAQPYSASIFNISALSFGSLSANAIRALNNGAARGGFYHDTGEGSISRYHLEGGGDLVWEIGSGYFGCRDDQGRFDEALFVENATREAVKMVEVKLSQGAKPGHGGILPGAKVTPEIAEARGVPVGEDVVSPASHSAFSTPIELLEFLDRLRTLCGGKPVGFKLAIGHPWEWFAIVKAMLETGRHPDFIVVDGSEGGTGAAPLEFINRLGMPMLDALLLVHNTLVGANLREHIAVGSAGKVTSGFHLAKTLALGADWCNAGRGYMFALGCIQALNCHTGRCPSGVATQDPRRGSKLDVPLKSERVHHFHRNTVQAFGNLIGAAGLRDASELGPDHIIQQTSQTAFHTYRDLFPFLEPGALLEGATGHELFDHYWDEANPREFGAPSSVIKFRRNPVR